MFNPAAHFWTVAPDLRARIHPLAPPPSVPWAGTVADPGLGPVRLSGFLSPVPGADTVVVILHGLGGSPDRPYAVRGARAAVRRGWAALRLAQRGADRSGEDLHHGGLVADVAAAVASPELAGYARVLLLGYSLGGHLALRTLVDSPDPRIRAGAAVCAPLDLDRGARHLDEHCAGIYRRHVLRAMAGIYAAVAARRTLPHTVAEVRRARGIREFDRLAVVPRFGYRDPEDYYATESVAPRLRRLSLPALYLGSVHDPMVPPSTVRDLLAGAPPALTARWTGRGGHVGFPGGLDLGQGGIRGLENQIMAWLARVAG